MYAQVVQQLIRRIPEGHQVKREVDFILNQISDTMTPMHYHIREVIFVTYNKVSSRTHKTGFLYMHLACITCSTSWYTGWDTVSPLYAGAQISNHFIDILSFVTFFKN